MAAPVSKYRKFTRKEKREAADALRRVLAEMPDANMVEVADELNRRNIPHVNGQWNNARVTQFRARNRLRMPRQSSAEQGNGHAPAPQPKTTDKVQVAEIVLASNMGTSEKEAVMRALFGGAE